MALEIVILGSGTSTGVPMIGCHCEVCHSTDPRDQRTRSSALVRYTHDKDPTHTRHILIDTSPELRQQSIRQNLQHIDAVMFTHSHADHIFGLDDLRRFNSVMQRSIDIHAEATTMEVIRSTFRYIFDPSRNVNDSFIASLTPRTIEVDQPMNLHGATWTPIRLMHGRLPILGFRIDQGEHSMAYCTDVSSFPPQTLAQLRNLDVLVIDALRFRHHPTHQTVEQALGVIDHLKPRRAYLTHIAHDILHAKVEPELPEHVYLACDGLVVRCGL